MNTTKRKLRTFDNILKIGVEPVVLTLESEVYLRTIAQKGGESEMRECINVKNEADGEDYLWILSHHQKSLIAQLSTAVGVLTGVKVEIVFDRMQGRMKAYTLYIL